MPAIPILLDILLVIFALNTDILLANNRCGDGWEHVKHNGRNLSFLTEGGKGNNFL